MYRFLIIAYKQKVDDEVGTMKEATEIFIVAENAAEAIQKAKAMIVAGGYFIKRIEEVESSHAHVDMLNAFKQAHEILDGEKKKVKKKRK